MLRIGLFAIGLAMAFGAAFALGDALDPDVGDAGDIHGGDAAAASHDRSAAHGGPARLEIADRTFEPGVRQTLAFRIVDGRGRTVRDFDDVQHARAMHVLSVRRDLTGYRHVHPRQTADGGWTVDVVFPEPGPRRVFADFVVGGESHTLAADVNVVGEYDARRLPAPAQTAAAGGGYVVTEHDGIVRTAAFTERGSGAPPDHGEAGHGH